VNYANGADDAASTTTKTTTNTTTTTAKIEQSHAGEGHEAKKRGQEACHDKKLLGVQVWRQIVEP